MFAQEHICPHCRVALSSAYEFTRHCRRAHKGALRVIGAGAGEAANKARKNGALCDAEHGAAEPAKRGTHFVCRLCTARPELAKRSAAKHFVATHGFDGAAVRRWITVQDAGELKRGTGPGNGLRAAWNARPVSCTADVVPGLPGAPPTTAPGRRP